MKPKILVGSLLSLLFVTCASAQMSVHHINIGQGDATLFEFKTSAVMIDAGGSRTNASRDHLLAYLDAFFARRSDLNNTFYSLIVTHPHADHSHYVDEVLNRYRVRNFVDNGEDNEEDGGGVDDLMFAREFVRQKNLTQPGSMIYNRVDEEDITGSGYQPQWFKDLKNSDSKADILFLNGSRNCQNVNNDSLVIRVKYKTTKVLITGDAEWDDEDETCTPAIPRMLDKFASNTLLNVDVYKVGHHGSPNGTNEDYLTRMSPKISVISAGASDDTNAKRYGHPRKSVIDQLIEFTSGARSPVDVYGFDRGNGEVINLSLSKAVYCTCWDGDIVISRTASSAVLNVSTN